MSRFGSAGILVGADDNSSCELLVIEFCEGLDTSPGFVSLFRLLDDDDLDKGSLKRERLGVGNDEASGGSGRR